MNFSAHSVASNHALDGALAAVFDVMGHKSNCTGRSSISLLLNRMEGWRFGKPRTLLRCGLEYVVPSQKNLGVGTRFPTISLVPLNAQPARQESLRNKTVIAFASKAALRGNKWLDWLIAKWLYF